MAVPLLPHSRRHGLALHQAVVVDPVVGCAAEAVLGEAVVGGGFGEVPVGTLLADSGGDGGFEDAAAAHGGAVGGHGGAAAAGEAAHDGGEVGAGHVGMFVEEAWQAAGGDVFLAPGEPLAGAGDFAGFAAGFGHFTPPSPANADRNTVILRRISRLLCKSQIRPRLRVRCQRRAIYAAPSNGPSWACGSSGWRSARWCRCRLRSCQKPCLALPCPAMPSPASSRPASRCLALPRRVKLSLVHETAPGFGRSAVARCSRY